MEVPLKGLGILLILATPNAVPDPAAFSTFARVETVCHVGRGGCRWSSKLSTGSFAADIMML